MGWVGREDLPVFRGAVVWSARKDERGTCVRSVEAAEE